MTWRHAAACAGTDPDIFYPVPETPPGRRPAQPKPDYYEQARAICAKCPVRDQCLTEAMAEESGQGSFSRWGMRGGLTPRERYTLPWRICKRCGTRFATRKPRSMTCSAECYAANRRDAVERYQANLRAEAQARAALEETDCWCGYVARNSAGLVNHQRQTHGAAA